MVSMRTGKLCGAKVQESHSVNFNPNSNPTKPNHLAVYGVEW